MTAGGRPVVLSTFELRPGQRPPAGAEVIAGLDPGDRSVLEGAVGLILTGGGDVQPSLYGQRPHPRTYNVSPRRDAFELMLLEEALERDMPVLAICRGMQLLNVALGGTLEQHLSDVGGRLEHDRDRPRAEVAHDVRVEEGSIAADIFGSLRVGVNSHHHQGLGKVPEVLEEIAWADDGVLEAAVSRVHPWVLAVQWHPEVMADTDERQMDLFRAFVAATSTYREAEGAAAAKSA